MHLLRKWIVSLVPVLLIGAVAGCSDSDEEVQPEVKLTVVTESVSVEAAGGSFKATYRLEGVAEGVKPQVECGAKWIKGFDLSKAGEISFTVEPNEEEIQRQTTVEVSYGDLSGEFTVTQAGAQKPPVKLTVSPEAISAEAAGGSYKVTYVLENAPEGEKPEANCTESWVNGFDLSKAGEITFNVDANAVEAPREVKVLVAYNEAVAEFTVTQAAAAHIPAIGIEIKEIYDAGVLYRIAPEDPEMTYISLVTDKSYFDSYATEEDYFKDELKFFQDCANAKKQSLSEYLATVLKKGEVTGPAYRLKPEREYYIYAYGLTANGERLTPIYKQGFTTIAVEPSNVELKIDYIVSGTTVSMTITPSDPEQLYVFNAMSAAEATSDEVMLNAAQREIDQYIEYYEALFGVPQDEAVPRFASKGVTTYTFEGLPPESEFVGYVVAVNRLGSICSNVVSKPFATTVDKPNEDPIKLTLTALSKREVSVMANPTMPDHYVVGVDMALRWEGMTDEQILNRLVAGYQWQVKGSTGDHTFTFYNLMPQTDYCIFAFGYVGGVATTKLCRLDFKTKDAASVDIFFKMVYDKYYDGDEMIDLYGSKYYEARGKAVFPISIVTEGSDYCKEVFYLFYSGDYSDTEAYPDDMFLGDLIEYGEWMSTNCFYPAYDRPHTMIGFGAGSDMEMGPISRQVVTLTREGASPASEFPAPASTNVYRGKTRRYTGFELTSLSKIFPTPAAAQIGTRIPRTMPYKATAPRKENPRRIIGL